MEDRLIYCMSDIHGHMDAFEKALASIDLTRGHLVLLGDYLNGPDDLAVMATIEALWTAHKNISVLLGNHEEPIWLGAEDHPYQKLIRQMSLWTESCRWDKSGRESIILAHAGINERAGDRWKHRTDEGMFMEKYPPSFGKFQQTIVSGHVGTSTIRGNDNHHIFWDGESHYYIDGTVKDSGVIPVLVIDKDHFYEIYDGVAYPIKPEKPATLKQ